MHCFDQDMFKFQNDTTVKIEHYTNMYKYTFRAYTGDKDRFYLYMPLTNERSTATMYKCMDCELGCILLHMILCNLCFLTD